MVFQQMVKRKTQFRLFSRLSAAPLKIVQSQTQIFETFRIC